MNPPTPAAIMDRLDLAVSELHLAAKAALTLAKNIVATSQAIAADDDEWTRMPTANGRCPISGMSRSSLNRKVELKEVRRKRTGGFVYYSGADVRKTLTGRVGA